MGRMVKTNIGEIPIEDYRDIRAYQCGFGSYEDLYSQGYRLGDGYDYTEEEWEEYKASHKQK